MVLFLQIDKVSAREIERVSREGVQRDLLPLIEEQSNTKHGPIKQTHSSLLQRFSTC